MPLLIAATHHHHTHICGGVTDRARLDAEGVISDDIIEEGVISDDIIDCDTFSDDRRPRVWWEVRRAPAQPACDRFPRSLCWNLCIPVCNPGSRARWDSAPGLSPVTKLALNGWGGGGDQAKPWVSQCLTMHQISPVPLAGLLLTADNWSDLDKGLPHWLKWEQCTDIKREATDTQGPGQGGSRWFHKHQTNILCHNKMFLGNHPQSQLPPFLSDVGLFIFALVRWIALHNGTSSWNYLLLCSLSSTKDASLFNFFPSSKLLIFILAYIHLWENLG